MNDIKEIMAKALVVELIVKRKIKISFEDAMATVQFQLDKLKEDDGFVIVPKEANDDILNRMKAKNYLDVKFTKAIYKIIIEAAQGGDV